MADNITKSKGGGKAIPVREYLWYLNKSVVIGKIVGDTFYKSVPDRLFLAVPPAISLGDETLATCREHGVQHLQVVNRDTGAVYTSTLENFDAFSKPIPEGTRGRASAQHFLVLYKWDCTEPAPKVFTPTNDYKLIDAMRAAGQKPRNQHDSNVVLKQPAQMSLFAEAE